MNKSVFVMQSGRNVSLPHSRAHSVTEWKSLQLIRHSTSGMMKLCLTDHIKHEIANRRRNSSSKTISSYDMNRVLNPVNSRIARVVSTSLDELQKIRRDMRSFDERPPLAERYQYCVAYARANFQSCRSSIDVRTAQSTGTRVRGSSGTGRNATVNIELSPGYMRMVKKLGTADINKRYVVLSHKHAFDVDGGIAVHTANVFDSESLRPLSGYMAIWRSDDGTECMHSFAMEPARVVGLMNKKLTERVMNSMA